MQSHLPSFPEYLLARSMWTAICIACFIALQLVARVNAHPPGPDGHHEDQSAGETESPKIGVGLILPEIDGPKPWSAKPAFTNPNRFSIAIMTDRTGGHRPGIWMKAVERVNWLRPDFVVSVGDLIEGYTEDDVEIERQWTEFLGFIDQMDMKFFFVPGNHDVTNPKLHRIWREKFGKEWYSFDYKGVHFVCMNSEDPSAHIGDEQLQWLESDLKANEDARWTLMFLHKPIWTTAERDAVAGNEDSSNWTKVEQLLGDRPRTVFAGHVHHYVQYERSGRYYYSLATTGGSSAMRGIPYGEFDHITWLTMEEDGPRVANLLLDGIQPANVVTESSIDRFRTFLQASHITVEPILISGNELQVGEIRVGLQNDFDLPVQIQGKIEGLPLVGLSMESQLIELTAPAGQSMGKTVRFELKQPVDLERFKATVMTVKISTIEDNPLRAEWTLPVVIDKEYELIRQTIDVDGNMEEWSACDWWSTTTPPQLAGAIDQWTGESDCSFRIASRYDDQSIYFAASVDDDQVMAGDTLTIAIDPRLQLDRLTNTQMGRDMITASVRAPLTSEITECELVEFRGRASRNIKAFGRKTASGYEIELSVPTSRIVDLQGPDWSTIQMGARARDVDSEGELPLAVLWRASEESRSNRDLAHVIKK